MADTSKSVRLPFVAIPHIFKEDYNPILVPDPQFHQAGSKLLCGGVYLPIGPALIAADKGDLVRRARGRVFEKMLYQVWLVGCVDHIVFLSVTNYWKTDSKDYFKIDRN